MARTRHLFKTLASLTAIVLTSGSLTAASLVAAPVVGLHARPAHAGQTTSWLRGVNWADQRDNFVNGVLHLSGLSAAETYASAAATANQVVGQLYSITGANTVRMPVNEPTVTDYWDTYTGAIDTALGKGTVILAYWAHTGGKPQDTAKFNQMWDTIVARYGSNPNAYFEVINEPYGYGTTDLNSMYATWLGRYPRLPRARVILDGAGYATNVAAVGRDSRLNGTLLAVHDYSFFVDPPYDSETQWAERLKSTIGAYAGRTVATEWGGPMATGRKYDITWSPIDYSVPSGGWFADYIRGISSQLRSLGVGSVYWPGLRDGDWYSLTTRSGTGADLRLTLANRSGLLRLRYAWGITGTGGGTYVGIRNAGTGRYADGQGATGDGTTVGQAAGDSAASQQWTIENSGNYVQIKNRATGLYLDGTGGTTGGAVRQRAGDAGSGQQWSVITDANNVRVRNRATGLYLDAAGDSEPLVQAGDTNGLSQQWTIVAAGDDPTDPTGPTDPAGSPASQR